MAKKSKQDLSAQTHINDYERRKMLRVQENQEKLRQFGLKNIAKSLTSLVESKKTKKKKTKLKVNDDRDVEYNRNNSNDSEGDSSEEAEPNIGVPKKQNRPKFIAPMSMNRYANLAKQRRVIAPKVPSMLPFEDDCDGNGRDGISDTTKKSRLQQYGEGRERNHHFVDTNATKHNYTNEKVTMGSLILNKKGSQMKRGETERSLAKPKSIATSKSNGPRRKLFLVDSDDDGDNDAVFEDGRGKHVEDDDNQMISEHFQNGMVDDDEICQEQDGVDDDANEDTDQMIFEHFQNGIEGDDIDDNLEDDDELHIDDDSDREDAMDIEDDELVLEQHEGSLLKKQAVVSNIKKRGPTMMHGVQVRKFKEREAIICNEYGQPIGPVTEEKDIVGQFSRFLGTIARNYIYAPLSYTSWHKVPDKEKMWEYVLEKYAVPDNAKPWVLKSIGACWRGFKCRLKKKHFYGHKDNKTRWKNRPKRIPEKDFSHLLSVWNKKEVMKRSLHARDIRLSQKNMHTAGPKSFARIREELTNEDPDMKPPNLTQMFMHTRKRTEGNSYVDTYDDTAKKIEQMKNYKHSDDETDHEDPFLVVMGKEYDGHRRLYGKGVTNKLIKQMNTGETPSYMVPREIKIQFDDMQKKLEEDHEKKRVELEEDYVRKKAELEKMQNDMENKREKIVEDAVRKLIEKLPPEVTREFLT